LLRGPEASKDRTDLGQGEKSKADGVIEPIALMRPTQRAKTWGIPAGAE